MFGTEAQYKAMQEARDKTLIELNSTFEEELLKQVGGIEVLKNIAQFADKHMVHGSIREEFFKDVWLPYFTGRKELPPPFTEYHWYKIAGAPNLPVDVIDKDNNVLFTVPPLISTKASATPKEVINSKVSVSRMHAYYAKVKDVRPISELRRLKDEVIEKIPRLTQEGLDSYYEKWGEILMRYGYMDKNGNLIDTEEDNIKHEESELNLIEDHSLDDWVSFE